MGFDESVVLEHALITSSIRRAQEKIKEGITAERLRESMQAWLDDNLKK